MFTAIACVAVGAIAIWAQHQNLKERERPHTFEDDLIRQSIVFIREDMKLALGSLWGILVMLGIIADKLR